MANMFQKYSFNWSHANRSECSTILLDDRGFIIS